MIDFWIKYGKSFNAFCQHCNYDDWQDIIETLSKEIVSISCKRHLNLLDVGCGYGKNISEVIEYIFTRTKNKPIIDVVEPDKKAQSFLEYFLLDNKNGGVLRNTFTHLNDNKSLSYDCIIFMHSSYYIKSFNTHLKYIFKNQLNEGGKILILSLSSDSTFYLQRPETLLDYTSDEIEVFLQEQRIPYSIKELNSRFHLSKQELDDPFKLDSFYEFMTLGRIPIESYRKMLLKKHEKDELNFRDKLIIIEKINYE